MAVSLAAKHELANAALPDASLSEKMICINGMEDGVEHYPPVDIAYTRFLETINDTYAYNCVLIAGLFTKVYTTIHVDMTLMGKTPTRHEWREITTIFNAMRANDCLYLLLSGIPSRIIDVINNYLHSKEISDVAK